MPHVPRRSRGLVPALLTALLLALSVVLAAPAGAAGQQIENRERGFMAGPACLQVDRGRTWNNAAVTVEWCSHRSQHMNWTAVDTGGGWYQLRPKHVSGMCLAVRSGLHANGTQVVQEHCSGAAHQQWKFVAASWSGDFHEVVARHSGKCLDKSGWNVVQWDCHGGHWQHWSRPS